MRDRIETFLARKILLDQISPNDKLLIDINIEGELQLKEKP